MQKYMTFVGNERKDFPEPTLWADLVPGLQQTRVEINSPRRDAARVKVKDGTHCAFVFGVTGLRR